MWIPLSGSDNPPGKTEEIVLVCVPRKHIHIYKAYIILTSWASLLKSAVDRTDLKLKICSETSLNTNATLIFYVNTLFRHKYSMLESGLTNSQLCKKYLDISNNHVLMLLPSIEP